MTGIPNNTGVRDFARDQEMMRRIDEAVRASNMPLAIELARKAIAGGMVHPQLFNLRSYWHEQQGRNNEALADIERVVALAQDKFSALTAYGYMLEKLQRRRSAVVAFKQALDHAPNSPDALFNLGAAERAAGELHDAEAHLRRVIEIDPAHDRALLYLSDIVLRGGNREEARALLERVLAVKPGDAGAIITLARTATEEGDFAGSEAWLKRIPDPSRLELLDQTLYYGAIGDLHHLQGRFADAFAAYAKANAAKRQALAPKYEKINREDNFTLLAWLTDYLRDAPAEKWRVNTAAPRDPSEGNALQHVFLVGFPRSGTTLMENVLASHPKIVTLEEKELLSDSFHAFLANAQGRDRLAEGRPDDLAKFRALYWERVRNNGGEVDGKIFIDKNPLLSIRISLIAKLFPHAKILFALRDPRDVVLSCYRRSYMLNFSLFQFLRLEDAASFYDGVMKISQIQHDKFGLDWQYLRHEALVADFEGEAKKVCKFIGLDWSREMADFAEHAKSRPISTPSAQQVRRGLNSEGIGVWRNYKDQLAPVLSTLAPWVKTFGYDAE